MTSQSGGCVISLSQDDRSAVDFTDQKFPSYCFGYHNRKIGGCQSPGLRDISLDLSVNLNHLKKCQVSKS